MFKHGKLKEKVFATSIFCFITTTIIFTKTRQDKKDDGKAGTVECFQYGSSRPKKARMFFRSQGQRLRDADGEKRFQF